MIGKPKKIKAIIFDIGNVILFFNNHLVSKRLQALTHLSEEKLFKTVFGFYMEKELDLGKFPADDFLKLVRSKLKLKTSIPQMHTLFSDIFKENVLISSLIRQLKGKIPLIAISNTNESHFEFIRKHFPILHLLDHIIASCEVGVKKPHSGIYFQGLKHVSAQPQDCLFIDDQEKNITPARMLGFQTHLYHVQQHESFLSQLYQMGIL